MHVQREVGRAKPQRAARSVERCVEPRPWPREKVEDLREEPEAAVAGEAPLDALEQLALLEALEVARVKAQLVEAAVAPPPPVRPDPPLLSLVKEPAIEAANPRRIRISRRQRLLLARLLFPRPPRAQKALALALALAPPQHAASLIDGEGGGGGQAVKVAGEILCRAAQRRPERKPRREERAILHEALQHLSTGRCAYDVAGGQMDSSCCPTGSTREWRNDPAPYSAVCLVTRHASASRSSRLSDS